MVVSAESRYDLADTRKPPELVSDGWLTLRYSIDLQKEGMAPHPREVANFSLLRDGRVDNSSAFAKVVPSFL